MFFLAWNHKEVKDKKQQLCKNITAVSE